MSKLKIKRFTEDAILPTRTHPTDAGLDLYSPIDIHLGYGARVKINIHIGITLFEGTVGLILDRSSMGNQGVKVLGGVIDANYRGEIQVILAYVAKQRSPDDRISSDDEFVEIKRGDKIAQLIITAAYTPEILEVQELDMTDRNDKGFGSSGR